MDTLTLQNSSNAGSPFALPAPTDTPLLVARRRSFPAGKHIAAHRHIRGQFLFATAGTMWVRTPGHVWLVPPSRALWIPADIEHAIDTHGELHMRTLYLDASSAEMLPCDCAVLEVTALLRELIMRITAPLDDTHDSQAIELIGHLTILEISRLPRCGFELPMPSSPDLVNICETLLKHPTRIGGGEHASNSARTLYRRFRTETGLSFVQWRKQACLLHAVRMLNSGLSVTNVALELGYESPSAFSTMFRRMLGVTPRTFLRHTKTAR